MSELDERLERNHTCPDDPTDEEIARCPCCVARLKTMGRIGVKSSLKGQIMGAELRNDRLARATAEEQLERMGELPRDPEFTLTFRLAEEE